MGQTYVKLEFLRDPRLAVDTHFEVFFDGVIGTDGEARPGAGGLDMNNPLTSSPVALFAQATMHPGDGIGEDGLGEDGIGTGVGIAGIGDGKGGYDGLGYDGEPVDWISWSTESVNLLLRDGDYKFGIRFADAVGNSAAGSLATYSVSIRAKPRAIKDLTIVGVGSGELNVEWTPSPDLQVA